MKLSAKNAERMNKLLGMTEEDLKQPKQQTTVSTQKTSPKGLDPAYVAASIAAEHDWNEDLRARKNMMQAYQIADAHDREENKYRQIADTISQSHDAAENTRAEGRGQRASVLADTLRRGLESGSLADWEKNSIAKQLREEMTRNPEKAKAYGQAGEWFDVQGIDRGTMELYENLYRTAHGGRVENALFGIGTSIKGNLAAIPQSLAQEASDSKAYIDQYEGDYWKDFFTKSPAQMQADREAAGYGIRPLDEDSYARRMYNIGQTYKSAATAGLSEDGLGDTKYFSPKWLAEHGISLAENAPNIALSAINPVLGTAYMVANAGGGRALELAEQGVGTQAAVTRGLISGGIEALTEKFSIDNLLGTLRNNKGVLLNILSQMGVEASEESASYVLNYLADKAAKDPNAQFSMEELIDSALGGAFSGGIYGGIGQIGRKGAEQAQRTLGENSRKNYEKAKEQDAGRTPDFDRQFDHYNKMGELGIAFDQIPEIASATPISDAVKQGAYLAGKNDGVERATKLADRALAGETLTDAEIDSVLGHKETRQRFENAAGVKFSQSNAENRTTVRNYVEAEQKKPRLVKNDFSKEFGAETENVLDRLAKRGGAQIEIVESIDDGSIAKYQDGKIQISAEKLREDRAGALRSAVMHEMTHHIETSGQYEELSDAIYRFAQERGINTDALRTAIKADYEANGKTLSEDEIGREFVAKFSEQYLASEEAVQYLARENRGLFDKIREFLRSIVQQFTGTQDEREMRKLLQIYDNALDTVGTNEANRYSGEQHLIETLPDGRQYVKATRPVIRGEDPSAWSKQAENFINENIRSGNDVRFYTKDGFAVDVTERSAYKLTDVHVQSVEKVDRAKLSDGELAAKMRAVGHIDELIETARWRNWQSDKNNAHQNDIGEDGFDYFTTFFEDADGQYYRVVFSSGVNEDADTVYSIGVMDKRKHPTSTGSSNSPFGSGAQNGQMFSDNRISENAENGNSNSDQSFDQNSYGRSFDELLRETGQAEIADQLRNVDEATKRAIIGLVRENRRAAARDAQLAGMMNQGRKDAEASRKTQTRTQEALEREKQRRADEKEHYRESKKKASESHKASELREKIERHCKQLSKKLLDPNEKQNIPEPLRTPVAELLDAINLESEYSVNPDTGKRQKDADGIPTKRSLAFLDLRAAYQKIIDEGSEMTIDPDLMDSIDEIAGWRTVKIAAMEQNELQTIWNVLRAVEKSISDAGKLHRQGRFKTVSELAEALRQAEAGRKRKSNFFGMFGKVDHLLNMDMLAPRDYFHALGEGGDAIWKNLRRSFDTKVRDLREIADFTGKLRGDTDISKWSGSKATIQTFETSDGEIQMTPAQVMSLYMLMKRPQAVDHVLKGGIKQTELRRGIKTIQAVAPVHVSYEDVGKILSSLTDEQKRIADGLGEFMSTTLSEWGNETSMALYGYKKFNEKHYFPIQSDKNYTTQELGEDGLDTRVKKKGWTKATVKGANNAVIVGDIFDVFSKHADEMSTYHAFLGTLEDMSRVFNFKYKDELGNVSGSVKQTIDQIMGNGGQDYYKILFGNLNSGIRSESDLAGNMLGRYKAAKVSGNLRVIVQQPTSIVRAIAVIDPKYLGKAVFTKRDADEMRLHSSIAQWKDWGFYQLDTGRQMKSILMDDATKLERFNEFMMQGASAADTVTWATIWNACKLEVEESKPNLKKGSKAYFETVADRFDEIIDRTQVVDSVLHRSQIMRDPSGLKKMYTSFMAEPTKTYNLLHSAGLDLMNAQKGTPEHKAAGKAFARATMSVLLSTAATAAAAAVVDAMRDDEDETFRERWRKHTVENFVENINPASWVPLLKDFISIAQGYDVKRADMSLISDLVNSGRKLDRALSGEGKVSVAAASAQFIARAAELFGVPAYSIKRDATGIINTALDAAERLGFQTHGVRFNWSMLSTAVNEDSKTFWLEAGYDASHSGDYGTASRIFNMLQDQKIATEQEIRKFGRDQAKKTAKDLIDTAYAAQQADDDDGLAAARELLIGMGYTVDDIEEALATESLKELRDSWEYISQKSDVYVNIIDEAVSSTAYAGLTDDQKDKFSDRVSTYSRAVADAASIEDYEEDSKWILRCQAAQKECGLSESKFLVAYQATTGFESLKDKNGETVPNSLGLLKMQAIYNIPGLNDKQRNYMYEACGVGKSIRHYNKAKVNEELTKMRKQAK